MQRSHFTDRSVIKLILNKSKCCLRINRSSKLSVKEERKIIDIIKKNLKVTFSEERY